MGYNQAVSLKIGVQIVEIIEKAPAKINLGLDVVGKRADGYHELEMVMTSVDLADHLTFTPLSQPQIQLESNLAFLPTDRKNHVYQAAELLMKKAGITTGVHIYIDKHIPVAAGLAGGSSDCAAALRGLNRLWQLGYSNEELAALGAEIGSDVPYCLYGNTAFVTGRGETVTPLPAFGPCWIILVKPRMGVSTGSVFKELNLATIPHPPVRDLERAVMAQDYAAILAAMGNSLEAVTIPRHPIIQKIKDRMMRYGADAALMSGSGPTVFALCKQHSRAQRVYNGLKGFCDEVHLVPALMTRD